MEDMTMFRRRSIHIIQCNRNVRLASVIAIVGRWIVRVRYMQLFLPSKNGVFVSKRYVQRSFNAEYTSCRCVYQAINHSSGEIIAVKEVVASRVVSRAAAALRIELETLRPLRHENIVRFIGTLEIGETLCVAMEYCPGP